MTPLAAILAERGISRYELRRRTLLYPQTITKAACGHSVSITTWVKIAKALDVKLAVLVPDTGDELARDRCRSDALTGHRDPAGQNHGANQTSAAR